MHAEYRRLDAQVDVLGDENDTRILLLTLQGERLCEDGVVTALARQSRRQLALELARLEKQSPRRGLLAVIVGVATGQLQAAVDLLLGGITNQVIEEAAH